MDGGNMYGADQGYYCQMGPPPPMAQPANISPIHISPTSSGHLPYPQAGLQGQQPLQHQGGQGQLLHAQHQSHSPQHAQLASPPRSGGLTVLPPPPSPYGQILDTNSHSMTTVTRGYSPGSDPVSPSSASNGGSQQRSPQMPDSTNATDHPNSKGGGYRGKGQPYIPSYMDLSNGPEPCVVCSDAATGYHYRCMTCEGCKGFFRRTIQKNLQYHCKWNSNCIIDKTTRNQCQYCRFQKCLTVGMAADLVLNERQRVAKRKLIEDNRSRRKDEQTKMKPTYEELTGDIMTDDDRNLINEIGGAYEQTSVTVTKTYRIPERTPRPDNADATDPTVWQQLAEVMTPSIVRVVEFAKRVPGFLTLNVDDQISLLKSCCMEIMSLRAACRYNHESDTLTLNNGLILSKSQLGAGGGLGLLMEPIFDFAIGLAKLKLDSTEIALLASVLLMQSDRTGLKDPDPVEKYQDDILGAYKRYVAVERPTQPVHWAKILMKVTDLRTISTRHAERVLCIKLDSPGELPPLFLEMFDEGSGRAHAMRARLDARRGSQSEIGGAVAVGEATPGNFLPAALAAGVSPMTVLAEQKAQYLIPTLPVSNIPVLIPEPEYAVPPVRDNYPFSVGSFSSGASSPDSGIMSMANSPGIE